MNRTSIEWTDYTANPIKFRAPDGRVVWACEKVSPGCKHCYAEHLSVRYKDRRAGEWNAATMATLTPFLDEKELHRMLTYKPASGKRCFVGDMTDIFGEWVPDELLDRLFAVFALRPDVTWQVLTKRAPRALDYLLSRAKSADYWKRAAREIGYALEWEGHSLVPFPLPNVWLGVSVEDQPRADERIPLLLQTPAAVRFISAEPLLGPVDLSRLCGSTLDALSGHDFEAIGDIADVGVLSKTRHPRLDWVIVGGESGPSARPCELAWARAVVQQCQAAGVPVFVKQLGANVLATGQCDPTDIRLRDRKGGDPTEWPYDLRIRQFPTP